FRREIRGLITPRRLTVGLAAFALCALPLLTYNAVNHWATFRGNFKRDFSDVPGKSRMLLLTANGQGLFGYLTAEDWQTPVPHQLNGAVESGSARISAMAGHPRHSLGIYAFLLAILLMPLAGGSDRRAVLFALIAMAVAWIQMAITANAGGSVHHTILLWPLPQLVAGVSLAAASQRLGKPGRPVAGAVLA